MPNAQAAELRELKQELPVVLQQLQFKDELVAQP
jgi:hypothetical protein